MPLNRLLSSLLAAGCLAPLVAPLGAAPLDPRAAAASLQPEVVAWRRDIHANPELGNRETRTAALVAEHLRGLGLPVRTGIAKTGVTAVLDTGRPGPFLALRADMDALPVTEETGLPFASTVRTEYRGETVGVMHACGHDAHVAILMGVAQALVASRDTLRGKVMFVFQPAEEGAPDGEEGGADLMLKEGLFADGKPDAIVGLHVTSLQNTGTIALRSGPLMAASDTFSIRVDGVQAHGSRPWQGVDPIVAASQVVLALQTLVSRELDVTREIAVVTVGQFRAGVRQNIIPDRAELLGTLRTFDPAVRERMIAGIERRAVGVAEAAGARASFRVHEGGYPVTVNDPALVERLRPALAAVVAADRLIEPPVTTGAEDFSFFAREVPGLYFFVGVTAPGIDPRTAPSNHSPRFLVDEDGLATGTAAMLSVARAFLQ